MNGIRAYRNGARARTRQPLRTSILSVRRVTSETIEKGDIVWIEYDAWTVNPNGTLTLFDTTHDEVAKKEGKFDEKKVYIEVPVVIGRGRLFEGLEAALVGAKVGEIIDMDYGLADQFKIDLKGGSAEIHLPDVCKTDEKWFVSKFRVVADLRELSDLKTIRFVEEYEKKEAKAEPKAEPTRTEATGEA